MISFLKGQPICSEGYYLDGDNITCKSCLVSNCFKCTQVSVCELCQNGYILTINTQNINQTCSTCSERFSHCDSCFIDGVDSKCTLCKTGFEVSSDGSTCVENQGPATKSKISTNALILIICIVSLVAISVIAGVAYWFRKDKKQKKKKGIKLGDKDGEIDSYLEKVVKMHPVSYNKLLFRKYTVEKELDYQGIFQFEVVGPELAQKKEIKKELEIGRDSQDQVKKGISSSNRQDNGNSNIIPETLSPGEKKDEVAIQVDHNRDDKSQLNEEDLPKSDKIGPVQDKTLQKESESTANIPVSESHEVNIGIKSLPDTKTKPPQNPLLKDKPETKNNKPTIDLDKPLEESPRSEVKLNQPIDNNYISPKKISLTDVESNKKKPIPQNSIESAAKPIKSNSSASSRKNLRSTEVTDPSRAQM